MPRCSIPVRVQKPSYNRIVISRLEIIQPGFGVVVVAAVADGVFLPDGGGERAGDGQGRAPRVIGIGYHAVAGRVKDPDDVPLAVVDIVVARPVQLEPRQAHAVVQVPDHVGTRLLRHDGRPVQVILRRYAVHGLFRPDPRRVVCVAQRRSEDIYKIS